MPQPTCTAAHISRLWSQQFPSRFLLAATLVVSLCSSQCVVTCAAPQDAEEYPVPAEAMKQDGVPEGTVNGPFDLKSQIFPGTLRKYWVYVPAQYDPEKPACTLIVQDGLNRAQGWKIPEICDNLIHAGEMPVTVGVFVEPGVVPPAVEGNQPRFNRSFEYDSRGDRYARFLLEELIPDVSKSYTLSSDPNDRALAGSSSGGICAFNAAWERPDAFRRVVSTVGTFVGLRGGNDFPTLVRKMEPKPLRVFLQDGSNDLNIYAGDWWVANQDMLSALEWAGYEVNHIWGTGGHNAKHSAAIMPEALRWLWKGYPTPITTVPKDADSRRVNLFVPGETWKQISSGHTIAEAPACDATGELFFSDSKVGRIYRVGEDNKTRIFADQTGRILDLSFGPNGGLYAVKDGKQIVSYDANAKETVVLGSVTASSLVAMPGGFYFADPSAPCVRFGDYDGSETIAMPLLQPCSALAPTADHAFMHLLAPASQFTLHAKLGAGGELTDRQEFGYLHFRYGSTAMSATDVAIDQSGRAFVATQLGIQVLDQLGRVNVILQSPSKSMITGLSFGGAARDMLFATTADGNVFKRRINTVGVVPHAPPVEMPKPRL